MKNNVFLNNNSQTVQIVYGNKITSTPLGQVKPPIDVVAPSSKSLNSKTSFGGGDAASDDGVYSLKSKKHRRILKIIIEHGLKLHNF